MLQSPSDHCRPLNPLSPVSSAGDEPQTITSSQLVWFLNGASLHTPTEAECVQIAEATGSRVGSEGLTPGTRCGRPSIVGGAASRPCAHPTGAHQPHPAAPCGGGPLLLTARPGPTAARSLLCRLSGPPASAAPGLCPYSSPSVFQAFPAPWGAAPPAPELGPGLWRAAQLLLRLRQGQL